MIDTLMDHTGGHFGLPSRLTLFPAALFQRVVRAWRMRVQEAAISKLDERTLADIGFRRGPLFEQAFDADGYVRYPNIDRYDVYRP